MFSKLKFLFDTQPKQKGLSISGEQAEIIEYNRGNFDKKFPEDFSENEKHLIELVSKYTMTSFERLVSLYRGIDYLVENGIDGDIVECGVWKGGSMMLIANRLVQLKKTNFQLYLFDTYEGMSEPSQNDLDIKNQNANDIWEKMDASEEKWCYSSIEEVQNNLKSSGYPSENIHFIKGKVEDTIPYSKPLNIALLRLDTDWYESTIHELNHLYPQIKQNGILIIDDYGHWSGAKKAVDEYFALNDIRVFLNRIDYTGRLAIKL